MLLGAVEAPAGTMPVVLGPGLAGDPAPRGDRPRARGRLQPQGALGLLGPDRRARGRARRHGRGRRHDRRPPRLAQRGRRGEPARPDGADRGRHPARLPAGPAQQRPHEDGPDRQRPPRGLLLHPAPPHDEHLHARGAGRPRRDRPLGAARPLREALRRRAGGHHERQVRLLRDRGLPDRGREDRRAGLRRHAHRQRAGRPDEGDPHRPRPAARRGGRHLPEGRPERPGGRGPADDPRLGDHGRGDARPRSQSASYSTAHQLPNCHVRSGRPRRPRPRGVQPLPAPRAQEERAASRPRARGPRTCRSRAGSSVAPRM